MTDCLSNNVAVPDGFTTADEPPPEYVADEVQRQLLAVQVTISRDDQVWIDEMRHRSYERHVAARHIMKYS